MVGLVPHQPDMNDRAEGEPGFGRIDDGAIARDHAGLLQRPHPPPAGGSGHAGALGQILVRDAGIALQKGDQLAVLLGKLHRLAPGRIIHSLNDYWSNQPKRQH
ncbi:hypothetical protein BOS5A_200299 [Bosea sp. EC-HK365B]|nr:hypothetical protein BOS5A_200299 [Bosea sp. EC-HK365B]VXC91557.1 hypothetical protein BOSE127_80013 [Bosea sp. 127]